MTLNSTQKKEPSSRQNKTVFAFILPGENYSTRERNKLRRIKRVLNPKWSPVIPTWLLSGGHIQKLGPAFPTLILIIRACDWKTGIWSDVRKSDLAFWCGMKDVKSVTNHLNRMKYLEVEWESTEPGMIDIFLPDKLNPSQVLESLGKTMPKPNESQENFPYPEEIIPEVKKDNSQEKENNSAGFEPVGKTINNKYMERFRKLREESEKNPDHTI